MSMLRGAGTRIGAFLLDLHGPTQVIGRLREPLITANESEREGYVPNVVYSCGSLVRDRQLIIPYAMSDYDTTFATVSLDEVLEGMQNYDLPRYLAGWRMRSSRSASSILEADRRRLSWSTNATERGHRQSALRRRIIVR